MYCGCTGGGYHGWRYLLPILETQRHQQNPQVGVLRLCEFCRVAVRVSSCMSSHAQLSFNKIFHVK